MMPTFTIEGIIGEGDATASAVSAFLQANPAEASIKINSPGGNAVEGAAIMSELEAHGNVSALVQGIAASAASLAVMGAKEIVMHDAAMLMIHEPSMLIFGRSAALRNGADTLDKMSGIYAHAYARASGNSPEMVAAWMAAETWMSAEDALALNFIDKIAAAETAPVMAAAFDYSLFREAPQQLVQLAQKHGWAQGAAELGERKD